MLLPKTPVKRTRPIRIRFLYARASKKRQRQKVSLGALGTSDADDGAAHFCFSSFGGIILLHRKFQGRFTSFYFTHSNLHPNQTKTSKLDSMRSWSLKSIKKIETMAFESSKEPKHTPRNPPHPEGHGQEPCLWIIISFGQRVVVLFALVPFKICDNSPFPFVQPKSEQFNSAE